MRIFLGFLCGLLFGTGIMISGMASPAKVLNFFDIAGTWDPSLIFVMGGALVTTFVGYQLVLGRASPLFDSRFHLPTVTAVDLPLVAGSAIFGIGWGLSGFCPGGALPAIGTLRSEVLVFVAALIAGIVAARFLRTLTRPGGGPASAGAGQASAR